LGCKRETKVPILRKQVLQKAVTDTVSVTL